MSLDYSEGKCTYPLNAFGETVPSTIYTIQYINTRKKIFYSLGQFWEAQPSPAPWLLSAVRCIVTESAREEL